tara:strand:+ start:26543 stop:27391 length:849 start_codon:yes stop_codon:yes gene_type:complete
MIKVAFIGGLENGYIVYNYLKSNRFIDLKIVITYNDQCEKPNHKIFPNEKNIIKSNSANSHVEFLKKFNLDIIFVAGWSELLHESLVNLPKIGTIGFHPSKLPMDRGRSVLAWQIAEGYTSSALTMFFYNDIPDGGDIIGQDIFKIEENDYISDVLSKVNDSTENLMKSYFPLLREGIVPRKKQKLEEGSFRRLRTNKDSVINWNQNAKKIFNLIRAISDPYPNAIAVIDESEFKVYKSEIIPKNKFIDFGNNVPGKVIATLSDNSLVISTRDDFLRVFVKE